jgi:pilus assembly protein CpaF
MDDNALFSQALGALAPLFSDPEVTEIMVDGTERVLFERAQQGLAVSDIKFASADEINKIISDLLALEGRTLQPGDAYVTSPLPLRHGFWSAVLTPVAQSGPFLTIRRNAPNQISWEDLLRFQAITPEAAEFLKSAVRDHVNVLVAGGESSGKTTILNRVAELIPADERVVVVEEFYEELLLEHPLAIFIKTKQDAGFSFSQAMHASTSMRPDWLVFGEMRGPDAMTVLEIFSNGHHGMTTIHGDSTENSLHRLETFCIKGNPGLGLSEIRDMVNSAFRLVVYQKRLKDGSRKIMEIVELCGVENGRYQLKRLFRYNPETNRLEPTGEQPGW